MPRKRSAKERGAMFARMKSGISSKDLHLSNSSTHTRSSRFNTQTNDPRLKNFIYTGIGKKMTVKKSKIPPKKQPESEPTPQFVPKITPNMDFSKLIKPLQKISEDKFANIIIATAATGFSVAIGNPLPLIAYKSIKAVKTINDISNRMEKMNLREELNDITKKNLQVVSQDSIKQKTEEISKKVTEQSQEAGVISVLSELTNVSEKAACTLFQGVVNNTIDSGIGNMTNYAVDILL